MSDIWLLIAELALREKLTLQVKELTADLEHAKQNTKGRKSLAPKCSGDKRSVGTDSVSNKLAVGEQSLAHDVKESGHTAQSSASAGKEEEERVQGAAKTDKNKENVVNVSSAKLVGTIMWLVDPCQLLVICTGSRAVLGCCSSKGPPSLPAQVESYPQERTKFRTPQSRPITEDVVNKCPQQ